MEQTGLFEMRLETAEAKTDERHQVYFSGKEDKQKYGVWFLERNNTLNAVKAGNVVSSRFYNIRFKTAPFIITII